MIEPSGRWAEAQRNTPSFVTARGDTPTALDRPMPAHLAASSSSVGGSPVTPRRAASPVVNKSISPIPGGDAKSPTPATPNSSRIPRSRTPGRAIHDELYERGKLYEEVREARRERSIRAEDRRCRSVPRISQIGQNITREEPIVQRLYRVKKEKMEEAGFKRQIMQQKDDQLYDKWFKPRLSNKGARAQGKTMAEQHQKWDFRRRERLDELKRRRIMEEMDGVQEKPDVNPRSDRLAAQRRDREGLSGYTHVEVMMERDRLQQLARWEMSQVKQAIDNPGNPRITEFAATMQREGDVVDRLYEAGRRQQERLEQKRQEKALLEAQRSADHFTPTINAASPATPRAGVSSADADAVAAELNLSGGNATGEHYVTTGDDIADRSARYYRKRDEKIQRQIDLEKALHTPTINPVSEELASKLPQSSRDRLATPKRRTGSDMSTASGTPRRAYEFPDEPKGGPRSAPPKTGSSSTTGDDSFANSGVLERMKLAEERRQQRLRSARQEQEDQYAQEHTFKPETNPAVPGSRGSYGTPRRGDTNSPTPAPSSGGAPTSLYERQAMWARKRDEKLQQLREEKDTAEEMPYRPSVNSGPRPKHDSGLYGGSGHAWGYDEFVERQEEARRRQEDRQLLADRAAVNQDASFGSAYTPTRGQAPQLGGSRGPITSLRRPVEAPSAAAGASTPSPIPGVAGGFASPYGGADAAGPDPATASQLASILMGASRSGAADLRSAGAETGPSLDDDFDTL